MAGDAAIGRQMEILLVEDNLLHARLTMQALQDVEIKHRVTLVRDGQEACDFLFRTGIFAKAPTPDLILLDLRLPKLDGPDLLGRIRANEDLRRLPVVIMTASDGEEDRRQCEELDVQGYILKPIDMGSFLVLVKRLRRFWREDVVFPK